MFVHESEMKQDRRTMAAPLGIALNTEYITLLTTFDTRFCTKEAKDNDTKFRETNSTGADTEQETTANTTNLMQYSRRRRLVVRVSSPQVD